MQHTLTSKVTKPTAGAPLRERAAALLDKIHVFAENAYGVEFEFPLQATFDCWIDDIAFLP